MDKKRWQGIGASSGYAAGRTWLLRTAGSAPEPVADAPGSVDSQSQLARLQRAIVITDQALIQFEEQVRAEKGEDLAQIFAAHRLLLSDPAFTGEMSLGIQSKRWTAEQAVRQVTDEAVTMLTALDDPYFRERVVDIQDVSQQLLQHLGGNSAGLIQFPPIGNWVVMAEELTPAQTISLPKDRVAAFIVRKGGKTSHAAILARTYGIPAVVGLNNGWEELIEFKAVELDGDEGWIGALDTADLDALPSTVGTNHALMPAEEAQAYANMTLAANIGNPSDVSLVHRFKAQGVGLYRTEFLFMGDVLPTEEEQVAAYTEVITACTPHVTVIRTLDIGGDKRAPALDLPEEKNPFLGVRALRLCFKRPELFETQLRAIWRASTAGPTAVMFPMISNLEELRRAKEYLEKARKAVISQGHAVGSVQVGMMIEVPAVVWIAAKLAQEVDFFSIGTNDLIQYSLAVDRENSEVADLYQAYHPAVLGMIAQVARTAQAAGIWTGICGEAGGDSVLAPFFAGLGIDELSMSPGLLPKMRQALSGLDRDKLSSEGFVDKILDCATAAEVTDMLKSYNKMVS
ncbi:phosphoenolpyruvate--protein phosphotransferase [Sporomusa sp.]|uniref:phosphoenolpyruvate--protein phosphotransferase n=1 Tax=Sporomusa sp. TaxID=2078658 RepID=UPI002C1ADCEF|nr:phosphoenolpyruvate--protein phosphotransferase [Sporomusa sp.]HWR45110.1 phosphoenolpyruvate--protein phosphotransferase [Sporomusa sp.]